MFKKLTFSVVLGIGLFFVLVLACGKSELEKKYPQIAFSAIETRLADDWVRIFYTPDRNFENMKKVAKLGHYMPHKSSNIVYVAYFVDDKSLAGKKFKTVEERGHMETNEHVVARYIKNTMSGKEHFKKYPEKMSQKE
jgi:hypothetical protein